MSTERPHSQSIVHQECTTLGARFTWHSGLANSRFHTLLFGINRLCSDALPHFWTNSHCSEAVVKLNSLQLQARSLLVRSSAAQLYVSPDTHDAMPRQLINGIGA